MNDNDYIVMIDENGQPYLAHAFGDSVRNFASTVNRKIRNNVGAGNRARKDHKYIMRVDNYFSPGKHLYLYTQDEVNAYMGRNGNKKGSRTLSNRIRDKLGWDERSARDDARALSEKTIRDLNRSAKGATAPQKGAFKLYQDAEDAYSKTLLGRTEKLGNAIKKRANTTLGAIRKAGKWLDDHDAGLTETVRYATKRNKVDQDERDRLHDEMVNSGRIGRLANRVGESNTAHRITEAAYNPGQAARNVGTAAVNTARNAGTAIKNTPAAARTAAGNISNIIDTYVTGNSAQQRMSESSQGAMMGFADKAAEYTDALNDYNKSLEGKVKNGLNSTVVKAKDKLDKTKGELMSLYNSIKNQLTKEDRAAVQAELNAMMGLDGSGAEYVDTHR